MKIIISFLIVFMFSSLVQAEESMIIEFNQGFRSVDKNNYYRSFYIYEIKVTPDYYIIQNDGKFSEATVGEMITIDKIRKENGRVYFLLYVPRQYEKIKFWGIANKFGCDREFDLKQFSAYVKARSSRGGTTPISGVVYSLKLANVRTGPGLNNEKIGQIQQGDELVLKEETKEWYRFSSNHFSDAWVAKRLTTKTNPHIITDNTNPTIQLYSPNLSQNIYRTEEASVTISGKAIDQEGIAFVTISGKNANLKADGSFMVRIKLKIGKTPIKIITTDINDNVKEKDFFIIREEFINDDEFSDVDFALKTSNSNPNAIAVVFGIEEYQYAPNVANAYNDADIIREYLISTLGLKRKNIYFKYNERATKGEFEKVFSKNGWIAKNADKNSEIYVFYAGHGVASTDDKSAYLIPNDIDPNYASTGYSLNELYQNLSRIKSKSITIILDACFSGVTRENEILLADSRPVSIKVKQGSIPKNLNVFTASSGSEISSNYSQKLHGLFTYFFLKGLNKNADSNNDRKITLGEMEVYLKENVSSQARKMGREQNPQLHTSDKDEVLLKY